MKNVILIFLCILSIIFFSRVLPHLPNFTPVISLAIYSSFFLKRIGIISFLISYLFVDMYLGLNSILIWTWGSFLIILYLSNFIKNINHRILAIFSMPTIFFLITNFGVWTAGYYDLTFQGLLKCYTMALPFYANTLVSTAFFSLLIEFIILFKKRIFQT